MVNHWGLPWCACNFNQWSLCVMNVASITFQVSRGGQSVTLVGTSLVIFGGEDAKRSLLNDLHILDLETMTWDEIDAV